MTKNEIVTSWKWLLKFLPPNEAKELQRLADQAHHEARSFLDGKIEVPAIEVDKLIMVNTLLKQAETPILDEEALSITGKDGSLWGFKQYEQLDYRWIESVIKYYEYRHNKASFGTSGAIREIPAQTSFALAGDWGTGFWYKGNPSEKVAAQINKREPDYTVHLGDTYYSGTRKEMKKNFRRYWPRGKKKENTFAISGNHEMYCGNWYFNEMLPKVCPNQKGVGYFALHNDNWLILGLDSSYYATGNFYLDGSIYKSKEEAGPQLEWLRKEILPRFRKQKIIVLTHHQPVDLSGSHTNALYSQLTGLLQEFKLKPNLWYFGHEHNAAAYTSQSALKFPGRCIGHGGIPYGDASLIKTGKKVAWKESSSANDPKYRSRILNGFMSLELNGANLKESFVSENGDARWEKSWEGQTDVT